MTEELPILHYASLGQVGGVERYLAAFLGYRSERFRVRHGVELFEREHPAFRAALRRNAAVHYPKHAGPLRLPRWPHGLREAWHRHVATRYRGGVAVIWNLLGDLSALSRARAGGLPCVYFERGLAWFEDQGERRIREFLRGLDGALANSHAGRRVLQLGWDYSGPVDVHRNALRADAPAPRALAKRLDAGRPLRLGTLGRLLPFKGVGLALHALAELRGAGVDAELFVAGEGPLAGDLRALAARLGLSEHVRFLGQVAEVEPFLEELDVLLHPALREPCANVVPEAMARATPVVGALVDGMGELVHQGRTGLLVPPTLPLAEYARLGAHEGRMPIWVYDPLLDRLGEPRLVDPARLAGAVRELVADPERYARTSAAALKSARTEFEPRRALEALLETLFAYASRSHGAVSLT